MRKLLVFIWVTGLFAGFSACKSTKPAATATSAEEKTMGRAFATGLQTEQLYVEACTQLMRGDYAAAESLFEEVIAQDPNNHAAMYNAGKIALEKREFDKAVRYAKTSIEKDASNYWYYNLLKKAYEFNGDYANALSVQEKIAELFPQKFNDRVHLAELYLQSDKADKAIAQLLSIEAQTGPNEEIALRKYQIYDRTRQYTLAAQAAQALIDMNPEETRYYQLKIEAYQKAGKSAEAVQTMEALLEKDPGNGFALLSLAEYYKTTGDLDKSDKFLFLAFENPKIDPEFKMNLITGLMEYVEKEPEILPRIQTLARIFTETHPVRPGHML
ncbi:MAG: tetratricopeptide repeat protein [Bacteroidia bacterium]